MANAFLSELGRRAPQLVIAMLAARQSPEALAAFQGGMFETQQIREAQARQAQLDEERRQQQATQEARAQSAEQRAIDSARRADESARRSEADAQRKALLDALDRLDQFRTQVGETASDPVAAENALLGRASSLESMFGVPQGQLAGTVPNMAPVVTRGLRADARTLLADVEKRAEKMPGAVVDDSAVSFDWAVASPRLQSFLRQSGHPDGQPFKPSQLREIAGSVTVAAPAATGLTYGELFPQARGTPQGSVPLPMKDGRVDLSAASLTAGRLGWVKDRTSEREIRNAAIAALRDRLRYALRNPGQGGASTIARQLRAYGLDPQVELDKAAREIEGENISRARSRADLDPNAPIRTADEMRQQFIFDSDPVARGAAMENLRNVLPGPVGTRQPVPDAVYDFVPGKGLVPATR